MELVLEELGLIGLSHNYVGPNGTGLSWAGRSGDKA